MWQTDGQTDRQTDGQTDRRTENTICRAAWSQLKRCDGQTDRQTDWTIHRAAWSQLKYRVWNNHIWNSIIPHFNPGEAVALPLTSNPGSALGTHRTPKRKLRSDPCCARQKKARGVRFKSRLPHRGCRAPYMVPDIQCPIPGGYSLCEGDGLQYRPPFFKALRKNIDFSPPFSRCRRKILISDPLFQIFEDKSQF